MIDGYLIRYFLAVSEVGNFSRAAARLNVTQPTLSAGIAKLETKLGVRLFERTNRLVALTAAGSQFLVRARRIAREYELVLQDISGRDRRRTLRLGVLHTVSTRYLEAAVSDHHRLDAGVALEIFDGAERDILGRLERGRLDLALTILRPGHQRFAQETLWREPYVLAVSDQHLVAYSDGVSPEELAGERMVVRRHCEALPEISRFFTAAGVRPTFALKTTNDDRALALVRADAGITVAPLSLTGGPVRAIRLKDFNSERQIGLLYGPTMTPPDATEDGLVNLLRARQSMIDDSYQA
jgi:DNA-binding transcriptional LysR family regulator